MDHAQITPPTGGKPTQPLATGGAMAAPKRKRRLPRPLKWIGGLLLLGALLYVGSLAYQFIKFEITQVKPPISNVVSVTQTAEASLSALPTETLPPTPGPGEPTWTPRPSETVEAGLPPGRINILLLGTDNRNELGPNEASRSDTLIVVSVDTTQKTAGLLSIPRDLWVNIPGHGMQKINAAYFFGQYDKLPGGGITMAMPVVSGFLKVPIQYYASIDFDGFKKVIDEIGGIDVYIPQPLTDDAYPGPYNSTIKIHFDAGCQHLNGERALQYARTRHADSDFGRIRRQQQVIRAVRDKVTELGMLPRYPQILSDLGNSIETNIPIDQQAAFAQLAGQIQGDDIYSAQIDDTMVKQQGSDDHLVPITSTMKPMLDWFLGRGKYASLRPGTTLTPEPSPTAALLPRALRTATAEAIATNTAEAVAATSTVPLDLFPTTEADLPTWTPTVESTATPPPKGQCR
jgi:LCP family protein required for cell wall assembly